MTVLRFLLMAAIAGIALLGWAYATAVSEPVVRRAELALSTYPKGAEEIKALLISDIHVAGPDMPPGRLVRIVRQINALAPDIVLIAGDLVSDKSVATRHYSLADAVPPLSALRPRLGTFAVLGNHDHWRNAEAARAALAAANVTILDNEAARAGPLAIGGLDDAFTGHHDVAATVADMRSVGGVPIVLSHSPDPFPDMPADVSLMLAGHTHCGQIRLPLIGAISYMSEHGDLYGCGIVRESGRTLIISAGLGTSMLPLRLGAVPDMWLIEIGGASDVEQAGSS